MQHDNDVPPHVLTPMMPAQMACSPVRSTMMVSSCSNPRNLVTSSASSPCTFHTHLHEQFIENSLNN